MTDKFREANIGLSKPIRKYKKPQSPDYVYDQPFVNPDTLTSTVAKNVTNVVNSNQHILYRISSDGLCSLNSIFTIMGFTRLRIIKPEGATDNKTFLASNAISPVYILDFFKELSIIEEPTCISKIELIAQFIGFECNNYDLKYKDRFLEQIQNIIKRKKINPRYRVYLQNLQLFITASIMYASPQEHKRFIIDNKLKPIYSAMDGDTFLGDIINEYFKKKSGLDISSLTITNNDVPQVNRFRDIFINKPFIQLTPVVQMELPVNPFESTKLSGDLSIADQNRIKQNTIYFLHSGKRKISGTVTSTKGHWDLVIPQIIHEFIENQKQRYTKKHEKWIQAFVDNQHLIMQDILSSKKRNHWMWYVFPSERPGRSDVKKIEMDIESYDDLFHIRSFYIGFLSTWCNILGQIAYKMRTDKSRTHNQWLNDTRDRNRVRDCFDLFNRWYNQSKYAPGKGKKQFYVSEALKHLTEINSYV